MDSPPKRMTRARAAAKASESAVKTTKIVTAAAKARTTGTATAGTKSTAAKRKTRADENEHDDDHQDTGATRAPRGRPRKAAEPEEEAAAPAPAPAPAKPTRGRPAKKPAVEPSREEEPAAPAKPRGRPRKATAPGAQGPAPEPAADKTTRSRAATATKPSAAATQPGVKKTVKFRELDKENMQPEPRDTEPATTGLHGRPARRGGAAAARTSKTAAKTAEKKKPLSPKKVTQMPVSRDGDSSEDELAMEMVKAPIKLMMKAPIKPPANVVAGAKKPESANDEAVPATENTAALDAPALGASSLGSPPRRPPASPLKDSLRSPAKRMGAVPLPGSTIRPSACNAEHPGQTPSFKTSLLQSAAKRPQSPIKGPNLPPASASKPHQIQPAMKKTMLQSPAKRAMPGFRPLTDPRPRDASSPEDSPEMKPLVMATPIRVQAGRPSQKLMAEEHMHEALDEDELFGDPIERLQFCGRLSAVLPRHADPILDEDMTVVYEDDEDVQLVEEPIEPAEQADGELLPALEQPVSGSACPMGDIDDPMALDEVAAEMEESADLPPREPEALAEQPTEPDIPMHYQLRQKDMDPWHDLKPESGSEDEAPSPVKHMPRTPSRSSKASRASRRSTIGLGSLAGQSDSWSAARPVEVHSGVGGAPEADDVIPEAANEQWEPAEALEAEESPMKSTFFEDEMLVHVDSVPGEKEHVPETSVVPELGEPSLDDIVVADEDVALAQEAHGMSALEPREVHKVANGQSFDDSLSEASQEYGDENQMPTDAAMTSQHTVPVTPVRPMQQTSFFTTTKVPLKPADDSTPSPLKKRSFSASRIGSKRPGTLPRSATVISYSPLKEKRKSSGAPVTPSKTDVWSTMGTPARTPRRDVDPALLRGAVVFVDVHTTEGADASGIFVELLNQMGARCVKTWHWNPSSPAAGDTSSNKVGITHVVYKDGGKRTLEKVREANRLVHCVGVSWVLDCERENEWLDEAPYYIDTTHVPRGGARRRKSMEPRALANFNGNIVSSPVKGPRTPKMPMNRRDSTMWMYTPSDQDGEEGDEELEWSCVLLTPVPKTPAPDAIARYAAELPETPPGADNDDMDSSPTKQALMMRTCPPKANPHGGMGAGILSPEKDEQVLQRLMAARRKSLQFAPKIGSPLSRTWE
ncbi:Uncharacterized protein TCAP_00845 [Tolypocladium capitatum]|uniref:BRCT domain-containing protein n=1 Tax=Tolypocladium capitatum TaxID=45235 RepID=A0A2K3QNY9_9HYPO|nr:Uncharacterized protein TCAP_00845 [Tolypocladium capitatum]